MEAVTAIQISEATGLHKRTILMRSIKETWPFELQESLGGKKRFYPVDQLPPSVQIAIRDHYDSGHLPEGAETSPESAAQNESPCQALGLLSSGSGEDRLPDWQDAIARARVDLITLYDRAKNDAKAAGGKKAEGATHFIQAFNAGAHPDLQHILGKKKISRSTVESWAKTYAENGNDYRTLAPQWGQHLKKHHDLTPDERGIFFEVLRHQNRVKVSTAIQFTKVVLKERGLESPSKPAAFKRAVEKHKKYAADVWTLSRKGEKALIDEILPFVRRDDSKLDVGDVLVADGHRCNFTVFNPFNGRPCRPLLIVFFDWKSRSIAGWAFALEENTQVISAALRNAIVGLGKFPKIVYADNGKAFRGKFFTKTCDDLNQLGLHGLYQRLGIECIFADPYNARAKIVERFFREFGETFERFLPSFTGANIFDKPASMMRNEILMQTIHQHTPMEMHVANNAMNNWWQKLASQLSHPTIKGATIAEVFEAGRGPGVDFEKLHFLMMEAQVKQLGRNGIRLMSADYWHESMYGLRCKVTVRYCLSDISKVIVHTEDGEYLCTAQRQNPVHPMARLLGDVKDQAELNYRLSQNAKLKKQTKEVVKRAYGLTGSSREVTKQLPWNQIIEVTPELVDEVAQIEAEHEGARIAERTPVIDAADFKQLPASEPEPEAPKAEPTPIYYSDVDKFYALLQKDQLTFDEQEFFDAYKKTDMGRQILAGEPDRAEGGNRV